MNSLTGTWSLIRLILRRDRVRLLVWIGVLSVLPLSVAASFAELYPTDASRQLLGLSIQGNPAMEGFLGPLFDTGLGGLVAWRIIVPLGALVALMSMFTVIRHTRAEEEAGRRDLLGSTVVGRQAPLVSALSVTLIVNLVLAAIVGAGLLGSDLSGGGSLAFALGILMFGWSFAGIAAVAAQMTETAGGARGIAGATLGFVFLLRVVGDATRADGLGWLSWLSPMGWIQQVRSFAGERWWVLGLGFGLALVLVSIAFWLSTRRDIGAGLIESRSGPATAASSLRSPLGLAWRLQRGPLIGWAAGLVAFGVVIGGISNGMADLLNDNPQLKEFLDALGGGGIVADSFIAAVFGLFGVVASAYAVQAALRLRSEEAELRAEQVLAAGASRTAWANSHLLFALFGPLALLLATGLAAGLTYGATVGNIGGQLPRMLAAALAQIPAVWVLAGIAATIFGLMPRLVIIGWAAVVGSFLIGQIGAALQFPQAVLNLSPFTHVPLLPGAEATPTPFLWLTGVALVLLAVGVSGFRRRDLST
jgi:ABC-2 type transport system permease protein